LTARLLAWRRAARLEGKAVLIAKKFARDHRFNSRPIEQASQNASRSWN
jgi:hypothetical protein